MKDALDKIAINFYKFVFKEDANPSVINFLKGFNFVLIGFGFSAVMGLATQIVAGRILGPVEYGKYALIQAISSFLSLPMLMGAGTTLVKYSAEKSNFEDRRKIVSTSYLLFFISFSVAIIILAVFYKAISLAFSIPSDLLVYSIFFSFLSCLYIMSISIAQGLKEMKTLAVLQIIYGISGIAAFLIFIGIKIISFKAILFASSINYIIVAILAIFIFRKYFSFSVERDLLKKFIKYGFYAFLGAIASIIYFNFDRLVINKFFGTSQVGIYGAYYVAFISTAGFIFNIFNIVFFPVVSGIQNKEAMFAKINKFISKLLIPVLLFIFLMGSIIVKLYGGKYQFNLWLCIFFSLASALSLLNGIYFWSMSAIGHGGARVTSFASITAAVINIASNIILVPKFGFFGALISMILSYCSSIIFIFLNKRHYKLSEPANV